MPSRSGRTRAGLKVVGTVSKPAFPTIEQFAQASPREGSISTGDESVVDPMRARPMPASVTALLP